MMDIKTSSLPPPGGILHFSPAVGKMGPDKRECCADAFLRMVSESPPGHPKSCLAAGAQCPFKLAQPVENALTSTIESSGIIGNKATIPTDVFSTILMGIISAKLIMIPVFVGGAMVIRSMLRRRNAGGGVRVGGGGGGGGGGSPAPTGGDHSSESTGGAAPMQDEQAMAWEVPCASLVAGSD